MFYRVPLAYDNPKVIQGPISDCVLQLLCYETGSKDEDEIYSYKFFLLERHYESQYGKQTQGASDQGLEGSPELGLFKTPSLESLKKSVSHRIRIQTGKRKSFYIIMDRTKR
jgi:hypothetical protein